MYLKAKMRIESMYANGALSKAGYYGSQYNPGQFIEMFLIAD